MQPRWQQAKVACPQGDPQQGPLKPPNMAHQREVTLLRDGGFTTQAAEAVCHAQWPDTIVRDVQREINAKVKNNPIQLLAGRWSSSVKQTGNFIFTIQGKVDFPLISLYSRFLLAPFPGAQIAPTGAWMWAQIRGVPIWDEDDTPHSQNELLEALRSNPAFENAILTISPRWQIPVEGSLEIWALYSSPTVTPMAQSPDR
jgi:hypothetical protein